MNDSFIMNKMKATDLNKIIESSINIFSLKGYRNTQMVEIARDIGVSSGYIYTYFESKEALFDFLLRHIFLNDSQTSDLSTVSNLKSASMVGSTYNSIKERYKANRYFPILFETVINKKNNNWTDNFQKILDELYRMFYKYKDGILLLERSFLDWPDLANFFFKEVRIELISCLEKFLRMKKENKAKLDHYTFARFIVDVLAYTTIFSHRDKYLPDIDDQMAKSTLMYYFSHIE